MPGCRSEDSPPANKRLMQLSLKDYFNNSAGQPSGRREPRDQKRSRIPGEQILCSTDASFAGRVARQIWAELRLSNAEESRGFESPPLLHPALPNSLTSP